MSEPRQEVDPQSQLDAQAPSARSTRATVLFADILGFTALSERDGAERAYFAVTGALRILDGVARRHGGSVDKYLGDSLMAVFGHPVPLAEPARAAAAAALEMREQLREYAGALGVSLELVVGINTGAMVAGDVRGRVIREFHVLGDAVNVAARLKARAPAGAIYLGPETREQAGPGFAVGELGRMKLKGKAVEVPIFELLGSQERRAGPGPGTAPGDGPPLVGRERELARLTARLEERLAGRGGVLLLTGEAGAGKSRLLAELAARPLGAKLDWLHARPAAGAERRPLGLLADLLRAAEGEEALGEPEADPGAARVAAALVRRAASRPTVVVLEDLERADRGSLAALPELVAATAPSGMLFVAVLQGGSDPGETAAARLRALPACEELRLGPLAAEESRRLVVAAAGDALSPDSLELVLARGAGNPARLLLGVFLEPALRAEREHRTHEERSDDAERRRATILFADITGFTSLTEQLGAERAYPIVVGCLQLLDEVARRHGGTVEKYLGDCVMALFGVPEAIEDAPRAAVNAAIEMRRRVRAYGETLGVEVRLDVHTGINTGLGIAGDISGPLIREFAVMGEPVSVADELKDLAPAGHVWVGPAVQRATRDVFAFRALEPLVGRHGTSLQAFEVLSQQEKLHRARIGSERRLVSRLVGRDRELALLRGCLARLREGEGGVVSVIAEAGLGKSRLLAELAGSEEARALAWREGRSLSSGQHASFHPIADLCRSWIGIEDEDDEARAREKLEAAIARALPDEVDDVLPFIATILGLRLDAATQARLAGLPGDALEKLILRSVSELLRAGSRLRPVVIVMDDLHWADSSSIGLLESLLRLCEDHPVLFVNLFRPGAETTSERLRELARTGHADRYLELELRPLDGAATRSLLHNLFRQGDIPVATRQLIEEKARGNPFYVEEVVRALVDEGAVEVHEGRFRATERIHSVVIPGTVQEVVMARVDAQPLRRRQILQAASVIGGSFHLDVLAEVVGERERLAAELEELLDAEFWVPSDRLPGEEYAFKHPLLQEVIYDGLLQTRRAALHGRVGEAIERRLPEDLPGHAGMLAFHYGKAGELARAEEFLFRAGDQAARAAAPSEALHFFQEASKLYLQLHGGGGDPEKRALLEQNIARALYYRGRFLEAIDHFNRALVLLGDRVVEGNLRLGLHFAADLAAVLVRLYGPRWGRRRPATPRQRRIMELRYARAEATVTTQPTRHLFDSMDTLAILQRIDAASVPGSGRLYAGAAAFFAFGGLSFDVSRRLAEQARRLVGADDPDEQLYERAMDFTWRVLAGDWSDAHEIEPARIEESVRNGQLWGPTTYLGLLGEKRIHRGDFDGARACLERIDRIWDQFQYDLAKTNHYYLLTLLALEQADWPRALEAANAYYDENPEDLLHILALGAKAKALTGLGDLDAAEVTLALAADVMARSAPVPPFHASAYHRARLGLELARLEAGAGAAAAASTRSARAALRSAAKVAWRRPEVLRLAARLHALRGGRRRAHRLLERSLAEGARLGAGPETARTWAEAGRLLAEGRLAGGRLNGLDSTQCLERARSGFEAYGLAWDLARLQRRVEGPSPTH